MTDDPLLSDDLGQAPAADLLFGIAALMIATLAVLLKGVAAATPPAPDAVLTALIERTDPGLALVARPDGVLLVDRTGPADRPRAVRTADLLDDGALLALLSNARTADAPVLIVIGSGGEEAGFVLEGLVARHGPAVVLQARLTGEARS